jgi:hypothetical protein
MEVGMTSKETASAGLSLLKEAILEELKQSETGMTNAQLAEKLDLRSDYQGGNKDYLTWSVLGLLLNGGMVRREGRKYFAA